MTEHTKTETEAAAVARIAREHMAPTVMTVAHDGVTAPVLLLPGPHGLVRVDVKPLLDPFRTAPERRSGTSRHDDIDSFCAHVNRQKDAASTLWLQQDQDSAGITAVYDYHEPAEGWPRFGQHRAHYPFPFSREWEAWTGIDGKPMDQVTFAEFLEDRIGDVMAAPQATVEADAPLVEVGRQLGLAFGGPDKLMTLSRGLSVNITGKTVNASTLQSGEMQVAFVEEHKDDAGQRLSLPGLFVIGIPVFHLGVRYRMAVRLRYRVGGGRVSWAFHLYNVDVVRDDAITEAADKVKAETSLPLFLGTPE